MNSNEPERRRGIVNAPTVVIMSIAILAVIHLVRWIAGEDWDVWSIYAFAFIPIRLVPSSGFPMIIGSQWWSFLTYGFLHADWLHMAVNSLWLLVFGTVVARAAGTGRFLVIAAGGTIAGAAAMLVSHWGERTIVIGASAGVSALMAASVPIMYGNGGRAFQGLRESDHHVRALSFRELVSDRRALIFMAVWIAITLVSGAPAASSTTFGGQQIAWEAHLGGFVAGLALFYAVCRNQGRRR